jgi:hypothetical protein
MLKLVFSALLSFQLFPSDIAGAQSNDLCHNALQINLSAIGYDNAFIIPRPEGGVELALCSVKLIEDRKFLQIIARSDLQVLKLHRLGRYEWVVAYTGSDQSKLQIIGRMSEGLCSILGKNKCRFELSQSINPKAGDELTLNFFITTQAGRVKHQSSLMILAHPELSEMY